MKGKGVKEKKDKMQKGKREGKMVKKR